MELTLESIVTRCPSSSRAISSVGARFSATSPSDVGCNRPLALYDASLQRRSISADGQSARLDGSVERRNALHYAACAPKASRVSLQRLARAAAERGILSARDHHGRTALGLAPLSSASVLLDVWPDEALLADAFYDWLGNAAYHDSLLVKLVNRTEANAFAVVPPEAAVASGDSTTAAAKATRPSAPAARRASSS
jgi:hypothetical protein